MRRSDHNGVWSFFDAQTDEPTGRVFRGKDYDLEANTPPGCYAKPGEYTRERKPNPIARIFLLEKSALRPCRELAVDPNNEEARRRLEKIEREIEEIRSLR